MITDVHNVTISEAVMVMLFSMSIVFLVLLIISFMMDLIRVVFGKKEESKVIEVVNKPNNNLVTETEKDENIEDDKEIVAVIMAAIAAQNSCSIRDIKLKSIKRTNNYSQVWKEAGKQENMLNRI